MSFGKIKFSAHCSTLANNAVIIRYDSCNIYQALPPKPIVPCAQHPLPLGLGTRLAGKNKISNKPWYSWRIDK